MKNLFIIWIVFQLAIIGYIVTSIGNEIKAKTYKCTASEYVNPIYGAILPLATFIPPQQDIIDYCKTH